MLDEYKFHQHRDNPSCFASKGMLREATKNNILRKPGFPQDAATAPVFDFERTYAPATRRALFRFVAGGTPRWL
jgi:hypothetical protein